MDGWVGELGGWMDGWVGGVLGGLELQHSYALPTPTLLPPSSQVMRIIGQALGSYGKWAGPLADKVDS